MDILYFLKEGASKCDNFELRCSLRSIEKYGRNVGRVFIVGYCPEWLSDEVIKIPYQLNPNKSKHKNLHEQLLYAIRNSDIGVNDNGEFLVSMDDHFYCKNVDFNNYPFYIKKRKLPKEITQESAKHKLYEQIMINTRDLCLRYGLSDDFSTIHRNMHMNRYVLEEMGELNEVITSIDTPEVEGFCIAQNYRKTKHYIWFTSVNDVKIVDGKDFRKRCIEEKNHVFSTKDFKKDTPLYILLKRIYHTKSKYEKYE